MRTSLLTPLYAGMRFSKILPPDSGHWGRLFSIVSWGLRGLSSDRVVYFVPDVLIEREIVLLTSVLFDFKKDFLLAVPAYLPGAILRTNISAAEGEFLA